MVRLCSVEGCGKKHNSHGYCTSHWQRLQKFGSLEPLRRERGTGSIDWHGYHITTKGGVREYTHRLVWESVHGPLPSGWHVHHINGERADNRIENLVALAASTHQRLHGKLTAEQVAEIRESRLNGESMYALGKKYGVCARTILAIVKNKSWRE